MTFRWNDRPEFCSIRCGVMARSVEPFNHHRARLHPLVYRIIIGLAAWLVLSAWGFFGTGYADFSLSVVTVFILVSVSVPALLWGIWRRDHHGNASDSGSLHDWLLGEFDIWQTHLKGTDAVIAILLPLGAVAFGMTIFAIVKHLAAGGV